MIEALIAVVAVGVGTYASRAVFIVALADRDLPESFERTMRNVGPAVLAALVASLVVGDQGLAGLRPSPEVGALIIAGAVAVWRRNVLLILSVGMATFWLLRAVTG